MLLFRIPKEKIPEVILSFRACSEFGLSDEKQEKNLPAGRQGLVCRRITKIRTCS